MENTNSFFENLQIAYTEGFLTQNPDFLTPGLVVGTIIIAVILAYAFEYWIEPTWAKKQYMKNNNTWPTQKEFVWFRVGFIACVALGTGIYILASHWPS